MSDNSTLYPLPTLPVDPDQGPRRTAAAIVGATALFVVVAIAWAAWAVLDVAVTARGTVIPPSRMQEVQSTDGGVVEEMLVVPGQRVRRGDPLLRLDSVQASTQLGESRQYWLAALAGRARADALIAGTAPRFDPAWRAEAPELIDKEMQLWRDAQLEHAAARVAATDLVRQRQAEHDETTARVAAADDELKVARESFQIEERLLAGGAGARADYLSAKQRLLSLQNQRDALQQSLPRLRAAASQTQASAREIEARARAQWGEQRTAFETKASALTQQMAGQRDRVERRAIEAPIDGVVNRVLVATRGGVALPGKSIVEIVPDEAALQMIVRVRPSEIGFIRAGQTARVSVHAFDSAAHGVIAARVERIGADAVIDERQEPYFEVQLGAAPGQLRLQGQPLPVTPGMTVEAGILTGERTVLQYLLKPVLRGLQQSLQER